MVCTLRLSAHGRWRRLNGAHSLAEGIEGVKFRDGLRVEHVAVYLLDYNM